MIVSNEIKLHQESINYLNRIFTDYNEVESLSKIVENPIIHMYPKKDTYEEDGELDGFIDAIFSEVHIYDTVNMTVWKSKSLSDGLASYADITVKQIKVFKDLSTLVSLSGKYSISPFQEMTIRKA